VERGALLLLLLVLLTAAAAKAADSVAWFPLVLSICDAGLVDGPVVVVVAVNGGV
jgi:hypothetical protein